MLWHARACYGLKGDRPCYGLKGDRSMPCVVSVVASETYGIERASGQSKGLPFSHRRVKSTDVFHVGRVVKWIRVCCCFVPLL